MKPAVLILEDDTRLANGLAREFEDHGYSPSTIGSIKAIPKIAFSFAVIDLRLSGEFGLDAIDLILGLSPACRIVVLSGYGSIATAVEAVKRGAVDYLTKPASFSAIEAALLGKRGPVDPEFKAPSLSQVEHEYIDFVLTKNEGNISRTAKDLGLHRQSLQRKLKKYT
ncbi:MAG: response regulator transcription factor [Bacteriovoracia bacterium]